MVWEELGMGQGTDGPVGQVGVGTGRPVCTGRPASHRSVKPGWPWVRLSQQLIANSALWVLLLTCAVFFSFLYV